MKLTVQEVAKLLGSNEERCARLDRGRRPSRATHSRPVPDNRAELLEWATKQDLTLASRCVRAHR